MAEAKASRPRDRPLSPHLQIYKPMLTMMMSIVHRVTGAALYSGMLIVAWWLISAAVSPSAFAMSQWFWSSLLGRIVLFGYTWALLHHMLGGIRHLIWDPATASARRARRRRSHAGRLGRAHHVSGSWHLDHGGHAMTASADPHAARASAASAPPDRAPRFLAPAPHRRRQRPTDHRRLRRIVLTARPQPRGGRANSRRALVAIIMLLFVLVSV